MVAIPAKTNQYCAIQGVLAKYHGAAQTSDNEPTATSGKNDSDSFIEISLDDDSRGERRLLCSLVLDCPAIGLFMELFYKCLMAFSHPKAFEN